MRTASVLPTARQPSVAQTNHHATGPKVQSVIVQAGGRGSRLGSLTNNRPKCLVSVNGEPILFALKKHFHGARMVIIGDYQYDALASYLAAFWPDGDYRLVRANGCGDLAGIGAALELVDDGPLAIVWSDLLFASLPELDVDAHNYLGLTREFECRWSFDGEKCVETPSSEAGAMGFFTFTNPSQLLPLPAEGCFLRSLIQKGVLLRPAYIDGAKEIGDQPQYAAVNNSIGRPYNQITFGEDTITKTCLEPRYQYKIEGESAWHQEARARGFEQTPQVLSSEPFVMRRIHGEHPFELDLDRSAQEKTLLAIFDTIDSLHRLGNAPFDASSCREAHVDGPFRELENVRGILPEDDEFTINGKRCLSPLSHSDLLEACTGRFSFRDFCVIHGECTFSNTIIEKDGRVWFIDPSPKYGRSPRPYGNPLYDWSKVYYSVAGQYDLFNRKRYHFQLNGLRADLEIEPSGWESLEPLLVDRLGVDLDEVRLMHALEWFLLAAHCYDDYDATVAAFMHGVLLINTALEGCPPPL